MHDCVLDKVSARRRWRLDTIQERIDASSAILTPVAPKEQIPGATTVCDSRLGIAQRLTPGDTCGQDLLLAQWAAFELTSLSTIMRLAARKASCPSSPGVLRACRSRPRAVWR